MASVNDALNALAGQIADLQAQVQAVRHPNNLAAQVAELQVQLQAMTPPTPPVYTSVTPNGIPTSTRMCANLPTFDGDMAELFAWIKRSKEVMLLFDGTPLECEALTIIRTKIVGRANKTLDNANVPLHFEAIIRKLIEAYGDKRPIDLLQGLLIRTKQNDMSIQAYYDVLCEKMNEIFYKIELENEGRNDFISGMKEVIENQAKDTFLTWINPKIRYLLQARNPASLQEARDIAVVLETKNIWRTELEDGHGKNHQNKKPPVVMEQKKQTYQERKPFYPNQNTSHNEHVKTPVNGYQRPFNQPVANPKPMIQNNEPMDVDKSTMQRNQRFGNGTNQQRRFFNANIIEGNDNDPEDLLEEIPETIIEETDFLV